MSELTDFEVRTIFSDIRSGMDNIRACDAALYACRDKISWNDCLKDRSKVIREVKAKVSEGIAKINELIASPHILPEETASALLNEIVELDLKRYDDPFFLVSVIKKVIEFYEENNDLDVLCPLYNKLGREQIAMVRSGYTRESELAFESFRKTLACRDAYSYLSREARKAIFEAYYEIACVLPYDCDLSIEISFESLKEALEFWNSEEVRNLDGKDPEFAETVSKLTDNWLRCESISDELSDELLTYFYKLTDSLYETQLSAANGSMYSVSPFVTAAKLKAGVLKGELAYTDALQHLCMYYLTKPRHVPDEDSFSINNDFYFETYIPDSILFSWMNDERVPESVRKENTKKIIMTKQIYMSSLARMRVFPGIVNKTASDWCIHVLPLLETKEAREKLVLSLLGRRQMNTFLKSGLAAETAKLIADSMVAYKGELLVGLPGINSIFSIYGHKDEICRTAFRFALFRNVGGIRATDIINTKYRSLTQEEQWVLNQCSELTPEAVAMCENVPLSEETEPSAKFRILYDIALISTVIAQTKQGLKAAMKKMRADDVSGYNPDILDLIESDETLYAKISSLFMEETEDIYWGLFSTLM